MGRKIIRRLSLIVFIWVLISLAIWFFQNRNIEQVDENSSVEKPVSEEIFNYDSQTSNNHIIFDVGKFNFELKKERDSIETTLVVKNGTKTLISKKYPDMVVSISKILFKDKNIILINYYSGGAHCCSTVVPYLIDDEKVVEGTFLDLGNIEIFNGETFFIKNDRLFTSSVDDRFAYFKMDYADSGSMFFTTYFELTMEPLEFVNRNELFVDTYAKLYASAQTDSKEKINQENCAKDEMGKDQVFASVVSRYTYGFLSGVGRDKLKTELSNDWWCFPEKDINKTEDDIYQALEKNNKSEDFINETIRTGYDQAGKK